MIYDDNNYKENFEHFIKIQYKEIEEIILSNETFGNNILIYLKESFYIAFYLINEYITDYLLRFDDDYKSKNLIELQKIIGYDITDIKNKNYLNDNCSKLDVYQENNISNYDDIIKELQKKLYKNTNRINRLQKELNEYNDLNNTLSSTTKINTDDIHVKINECNITITKIEEKITKINTKINMPSKISKSDKSKTKIINTYKDFFLSNHEYHSYLKLWKNLFNDNDLLKKSYNLSIFKILNLDHDQYKDPINIYYKHISKLADEYFNCVKLTDCNKRQEYIYDVLFHLTQSVICSSIEIFLRKILFQYFIEEFNNDTDTENIINIKINYILKNELNMKQQINAEQPEYLPVIVEDEEKDEVEDDLVEEKSPEPEPQSLHDILFNEIAEKFVKNSVCIFKNYEEKNSFQSQTIKEILIDYFNLLFLKGFQPDDNIILILTKNVASYFDAFVQKTINNWYVVMENTLRFVINQKRIHELYVELSP